jgi:hypothetical protein
MLSTKRFDFHVRVYGNGNAVVVIYCVTGVMEPKDKAPMEL